MGLAVPLSEDGCEGSVVLCVSELTKGKLTIGGNVVDTILMQYVTLSKSRLCEPPYLLSIGCNTSPLP